MESSTTYSSLAKMDPAISAREVSQVSSIKTNSPAPEILPYSEYSSDWEKGQGHRHHEGERSGSEHEKNHNTGGHESPRERHHILSITLLLLTLIIPLTALIAWAASVLRKTSTDHTLFTSAAIGGQLTQFQAKAIDFVSGAIFAPVIIACANVCWFSLARTTVFNDQPVSQKPVSLSAVTEMSITATGSYDMLKMFRLVRTVRIRFILFGVLVLASALASTLFANVIAYEAYTSIGSALPVSLHLLSLPSLNPMSWSSGDRGSAVFGFGSADQAKLALQYNSLVTGLNYQNASSQLSTDSSYIQYNVTTQSLNNLNESVVQLANVPAYKLSVECEPANLTTFGIIQQGGYSITITFLNNGILYNSIIPGQLSQVDNSYSEQYYFAGFNGNASSIVLGQFTSGGGKMTPSTNFTASDYGNIPHNNFKTTWNNSTKSTLEVWGIACNIKRRLGSTSLTRSGTSWTQSDINITNPATQVQSLLYSFQARYEYHAPGATLSGMGSPFAASALTIPDPVNSNMYLNWTLYAQNMLYASSSLQNTVFNLVLSNSSNTSPEVAAQASSSDLVYRMTYIPGILILALVAMIVAGAIVLGLTIYSRESWALRTGRILDPVRLVMDCVVAFKASHDVAEAGRWSASDVRHLAKELKIGYSADASGFNHGDGMLRRGTTLQRQGYNGAPALY
ncbi:hypothetical protein BGZ60DRAFT_400571 [Tricladium varicosporioides]|nr:hypothetical protein BGZ60DRAFT_400571 [Hymenoscyphus varicosporioides]